MNRKNTIWILASIPVLLWSVFYNGYPWVYPDTGTYIDSGFTNESPIDRPLFYGWFIRHTSLAETLFIPAFIQSLIGVWLIFIFFKHAVPVRNPGLMTFVSVLLLSLTTGISYYAGLMVPDIFQAYLFLGFAILMAPEKPPRNQRILIWILIGFSLVSAFANLLVFSLYCFFYLIFRRPKYLIRNPAFKGIILVVCCYLLSCFINYRSGFGFTFSPGSHMFLMGKLADRGLLQEYLDKNCESHPTPLCGHSIPLSGNWFLWDTRSPAISTCPDSTVKECWEYWEPTNKKILNRFFSDPSLSLKFMSGIPKDIAIQATEFGAYPSRPDMENGPVFSQINWRMKPDFPRLKKSEQQKSPVTFDTLNTLTSICIPVSLIAIVIFLYFTPVRAVRRFTFRIFMFIFLNLLVIGVFSIPDARYHGRSIWLIELLALSGATGRKIKIPGLGSPGINKGVNPAV
mgnify:CR=1 FL=1